VGSSRPSTPNGNDKGKEKVVEKMEPRMESMRLPRRQAEEQARKEEHEKKRVGFITEQDFPDRVVRLGKAKELGA
jgi:hypothetical protein